MDRLLHLDQVLGGVPKFLETEWTVLDLGSSQKVNANSTSSQSLHKSRPPMRFLRFDFLVTSISRWFCRSWKQNLMFSKSS